MLIHSPQSSSSFGARLSSSGFTFTASSSAPQSGQTTISPFIGFAIVISASHSGQLAINLNLRNVYLVIARSAVCGPERSEGSNLQLGTEIASQTTLAMTRGGRVKKENARRVFKIRQYAGELTLRARCPPRRGRDSNPVPSMLKALSVFHSQYSIIIWQCQYPRALRIFAGASALRFNYCKDLRGFGNLEGLTFTLA